MKNNNYPATNDLMFVPSARVVLRQAQGRLWQVVYRSPFGALSMTDKPIRETDYERVMRAAKIKNITVATYALLTAAASCALCVLASYYR